MPNKKGGEIPRVSVDATEEDDEKDDKRLEVVGSVPMKQHPGLSLRPLFRANVMVSWASIPPFPWKEVGRE